MGANETRSDSSSSDAFNDGTSRVQFDDNPDAVVLSIVETVAAVTDGDVTAMPPLFSSVDPEALAALVTSSPERPVEVNFSYEGCRVTVSSRGVVVEPLDE